MRIDCHCHVSPVWFEPVETLLFQMDRLEVERAVLVQLLGQADNRYQQACLHRYPGRFASVIGLDPASPDAVAQLRQAAAEGAAGVRLRPDARSPGEDPLAIWRAAHVLGLAVNCSGPATGFITPAFAELAAQLPDLTFVLEHLGGLARPDVGDAQTMLAPVIELARSPNVYLKVPPLGQLAARPAKLPAEAPMWPVDAARLILAAVDDFGPERLMWGSDFPPVSSREGYANALDWTLQALGHLPQASKEMIFGGTARSVFFRD